jgi:cell division control protein 6
MEKQSSLVFYGHGEDTASNSQNIDNFFSSYVKKMSIFRDKKVLTHGFMPDEILHRDQELMQISSILAPALKHYQPSNVFIYGSTGTGKTICVKMVLNQLNEAAKKNNVRIKTIYINCKMKKVADTEYRLFAQMLNDINIEVPDTGLPTDVLYRRFFKEIDEHDQNVIIILDEIDVLVRKIGDEFLYNLTRAELSKARISFIGITNNLSFSNTLDARVKSSLGEEEIIFHPYNALQLKDILKQRVANAFYPQAITPESLNKCAAIAAQEHGDARRALDLLRVAGEIAERYGLEQVLEEHIDMSEKKIDHDRVTETIKMLPGQTKAVLFSIMNMVETSGDKVLTGDVFGHYKETCVKNNLRYLTPRRVGDLINELDMLSIINTQVISKGRYGRTREIKLNIPESSMDQTKKMLFPSFN